MFRDKADRSWFWYGNQAGHTLRKIHWRAYAAAGAVLATAVAFTNGLDVIVNKLPAVVGRLTGVVWKTPAPAPIILTIAKDATKPN